MHDQGRAAKIVIGPKFGGAVIAGFAGGSAVVDEDVALIFLVLPDDLAGIHIHCDDGIRPYRRRFAHTVAGSDINPMTFRVDSRSIPNRSACGTIKRYTLFVFSSRF